MFLVEVVPLLRDNYAYLVVDQERGEAHVIDPSEHDPVLAHIAERGYRLVEIWNTHHHFDHVGGNEVLTRETGCAVLASNHDRGRVPAQSRGISDGDTFEAVGDTVRCLATPGHTLGAVSYLVAGHLFTGDTLFLAGCGRLFEGTPVQMWGSLTRLRSLPDNTLVWCGHEYTEANLRFALSLEPENPQLLERLAQTQRTRSMGKPTVPAPMGEERVTNPFLRADDPKLIAALRQSHGVDLEPGAEAFAWIREKKDCF